MGGGLMQVVALGKQDVYLTGNPQFTYFKVIYRRHTNFATESIQVHWDSNTENPALGTALTATIPRQAELVNGIWLQAVLPISADVASNPTWIDGVGNALVKQADIEIGGHLIDRHYGEWMNIWGELTTPQGKLQGYDKMVGNNTNLPAESEQRLDIPLLFWFCTNPGLALPLVALQNTEVKLKIQLETLANLTQTGTITTPSDLELKLWVDYVFLDTDERRRFAQVSHEYLMTQLQVNNFTVATTETTNKRCELWFDHPVKELNWVIRKSTGKLFDFDNTFTTAKLELDSRLVSPLRIPEYYLQIENYTHHQRVPRYDAITGSTTRKQKIYTYSFALTPENHQPSGTANFTRIDTAVLSFNGAADTSGSPVAKTITVYATNYNIIRFMAGAANLSFSI
jgi:hypothetical protein